MTEANLNLPYVFADAASIGQTGEFALCAPLEEDTKSMGYFLSRVSGKEFKRLQRVVDKKALPMNYALDGKSGLIFAKDYRREKVVAAYSSVCKFGLGMVLKIDQSELYSPVTGQLKYIAALLLALIVLGGMLLYAMVTPLVRQLLASKQALQTENEKHLAFLHNASDGIHFLDAQGNVIEVSDSFCAMLGYRREEMTGMNVSQWDVKFTAAELSQNIGQQIVQRTRAEFQTLHRRKDGSIFSVEISVSSLELDGKPVLSYSSRDITERKEYEKRILDNEKNLLDILKLSPIAVRIAIHNGRDVVFFNAAYTDLLNSTSGLDENLHNYYAHPKDYKDILSKLDQGETNINQVVELSIPGGTKAWALCTYMPMQYKGEDAVLGWFYDITERKLMEDKIQQQAFYDTLTRLPNRRLLDDRLSQTRSASKRSGYFGALMFLDLDNFKPINDIYGHGAGDLLLIEAANRLKICVREMDTVARFGGDEFVVILSELNADKAESKSQAALVAEKIRATLSEPYLLTIRDERQADIHVEHRCTASIGVVLFVRNEVSQEDLIEMADTAMYQAKKAGRNQIRFYLAEP